MNETEWRTCTIPWAMLCFLEPRASDRKLQLFAAACCRRAWALAADPCQRELVEGAERFADGLQSQDELDGLAISQTRSLHECPFCKELMYGAIGAEYLSPWLYAERVVV